MKNYQEILDYANALLDQALLYEDKPTKAKAKRLRLAIKEIHTRAVIARKELTIDSKDL